MCPDPIDYDIRMGNQKKPSISNNTAGYGTLYGTRFNCSTMYIEREGFSPKAFGLGVPAGFVGQSAVGRSGSRAVYELYHR